MHAFRSQLEDIGITFEKELQLSNQQQQSVAIKSVPSVFLGREPTEIEATLPAGMETVIEVCLKLFSSSYWTSILSWTT